jgi:hypothetical protein
MLALCLIWMSKKIIHCSQSNKSKSKRCVRSEYTVLISRKVIEKQYLRDERFFFVTQSKKFFCILQNNVQLIIFKSFDLIKCFNI